MNKFHLCLLIFSVSPALASHQLTVSSKHSNDLVHKTSIANNRIGESVSLLDVHNNMYTGVVLQQALNTCLVRWDDRNGQMFYSTGNYNCDILYNAFMGQFIGDSVSLFDWNGNMFSGVVRHQAFSSCLVIWHDFNGNDFYGAGNYNCYTLTVTEDSVTDIETISAEPKLTVFPNPAQNQISISIPLEAYGESWLKIFDMSGRLVMTEKMIQPTQTVDITSLSSGQYLLQVMQNDNLSSTKLFVIR